MMASVYVARSEPRWHWGYPVVEPGLTKLGVSTNPVRRRWALHRKDCHKTEIVWHQPLPRRVAFRVEGALKRRFAKHRATGEWFALKPDTIIREARRLIREASQ